MILYVRTNRLTYLNAAALYSLSQEIERVERLGIEGELVEIGCALGGSTLVMAASKSSDRSLRVFDTFEGMPEPSDTDGEDVQKRYEEILEGKSSGIRGDSYYGYRENLYDEVISNFMHLKIDLEREKLFFVKGLIQDTLYSDVDIALVHIDADWYESVKTALNRLHPNLAVGGKFIIDDYHAWSGCRKAVDEFLEINRNFAKIEGVRLHLLKLN